MLILKEIKPRDPSSSALRRVGGNRKPRSFKICPVCLGVFGPVRRLAQRFCSTACKVKSQTTGRRRLHETTRKAKNAQSLVRYHVRRGNLIRLARCEECDVSSRRIEVAHYGYDQPLRVRWLCRSCHVRWDKREPKGATFVVQRPVEEAAQDVDTVEGRS